MTEQDLWPMLSFILSIIALTLAIDIMLEPPEDEE